MAGRYIKVSKDQANDPKLSEPVDKFRRIVRVAVRPHALSEYGDHSEDLPETDERHILRHALRGVTVTLWIYADTHIRSDDSLPVTLSGLADALLCPLWMLRILPGQWLQVRNDGLILLPGYCAKNQIIAKDLRDSDLDEKRAAAAERAKRYRDKKKAGNSSTGTRKTLRAASHSTSQNNHAVTAPTGNPKPQPVEAPLASVLGHLAEPKNGNGATHQKSRVELEADALKLAREGLDSAAIAKNLGQYGVTQQQVIAWLSNQSTDRALDVGGTQ